MKEGRRRRAVTYRTSTVAGIARSLLVILCKTISYLPGKHLRIVGFRMLGARLGRRIVMYYGADILSPRRLVIGNDCRIGFHVTLDARGGLRIGDNCNIISQVAIWTGSHDVNSTDFKCVSSPVAIEDRVWISFRAVIFRRCYHWRRCGGCSWRSCNQRRSALHHRFGGVPARIIGERRRDLDYTLGTSAGAIICCYS